MERDASTLGGKLVFSSKLFFVLLNKIDQIRNFALDLEDGDDFFKIIVMQNIYGLSNKEGGSMWKPPPKAPSNSIL